MASSVVQSAFLDSLTWIRCTFCTKSFKRNVKFYILSCKKITCIECAKKMRSQDQPSKVNCSICKATVSLCFITETMPPHVRQLLRNPLELIKDANQINTFQVNLRNETVENQTKKIRKTIEAVTRLLYRRKEFEKAIKSLQHHIAPYRQQLLKFMPLAHFDKLLALSRERLKNLNVEVFTGHRRRTPRDDKSSPSSHRSRHSRNSSKHQSSYMSDGSSFGLNEQYRQGLQLNSPHSANGTVDFGFNETRPVQYSRADPIRRRISRDRRHRNSREMFPDYEIRPEPRNRRASRDRRNSRHDRNAHC